MRYINKLERDNAELNVILGKIEDEVLDLYRYLNSEKFYNDPYVNKNDVLLRLAEIRSLSNERR